MSTILENSLKIAQERMIKKLKHGGAQEESKLIKKYADQWCKDNGYKVQKRYFVYRRKNDEKK
tara:strand:- start:2547 stop:2735 length:189 start_codon:yes stop_codon:yes gene_type:complete